MVHYFCAIVAQKQVSLLTHSDFIVIGTAPRRRVYERQGADPVSLLLSANGLGRKMSGFSPYRGALYYYAPVFL